MSAHGPIVGRIAHGGRLDAARRRYPNAPQPWIDLSTGVNPQPYPLPPIAQEAWTRLPDDEAFAALEAAASGAYRAPANAEIVPGPGAQAFIQLLPRIFPARSVAVLGFAYAEHAACWAAAGASVAIVETAAALAAADVAVIVNPNNPDGRLLPTRSIALLAQEMTRKGGLLVVDESFMDFTPANSVVPLVSTESVIVLRSLRQSLWASGPASRRRFVRQRSRGALARGARPMGGLRAGACCRRASAVRFALASRGRGRLRDGGCAARRRLVARGIRHRRRNVAVSAGSP